MTFTINCCIVAGRVGDHGVKLSWLPSGKPTLDFSIALERPVGDRTFTTYVPIQVFGSHVEELAERLEPGDLVMIQGALSYKGDRRSDTTKGEKRPAQLAISTFQVDVLQPADRRSVPSHKTHEPEPAYTAGTLQAELTETPKERASVDDHRSAN
jgi:single-stranded DNA-binding protein